MVLQQSTPIQFNKTDRIAPPGPPNLPLVGTLPFLNKYLHLELHQLAKKYGNIFQLHVGGRKLVVLNELEAIKEALVENKDSCSGRADFAIYRQKPMTYFMESKSGQSWENHHKISGQVMRTFISGKLDIHESWVMDEVTELTNIFVNSQDLPINSNLYLTLATLSFMHRLLFDQKNSLNDLQEDSNFVKLTRGLGKLDEMALHITKLQIIPLILRPIYALSKFKLIIGFFQELTSVDPYFEKLIGDHRESFDPNKLRDMTDGLLKASSELTETDYNNLKISEDDIITGTLFQFTAAGGFIPSLFLRWALLYMIAYPDIQAKIHEEIDSVVGKEQQVSFKDRSKLPFTEACINEVFRHSSSTVMPPFVYGTNDDVTLDGYFIPKNTPLLINYYSLTRDERYWKQPEQFNPYRFLDENGKLRNNLLENFYPFGVGARRCIGEYLGRFLVFTFFTNLMHKCRFEKASGDKLSFAPHQLGLMIGPQNYKIKAKPRF